MFGRVRGDPQNSGGGEEGYNGRGVRPGLFKATLKFQNEKVDFIFFCSIILFNGAKGVRKEGGKVGERSG
jgi:hypothetical protein